MQHQEMEISGSTWRLGGGVHLRALALWLPTQPPAPNTNQVVVQLCQAASACLQALVLSIHDKQRPLAAHNTHTTTHMHLLQPKPTNSDHFLCLRLFFFTPTTFSSALSVVLVALPSCPRTVSSSPNFFVSSVRRAFAVFVISFLNSFT